MSDKRVLFVCYGGGHVGMVIPIVQEMRRKCGWAPIVLGLTTAKPKLDAAGISSYGFWDLVTQSDTKALEKGRGLLGQNYDPACGVSQEESIAYLGLSYADLEQRLGPEVAKHEYLAKGRHAFLPLGPLRRAISRFVPDVVVATCSPKSERAGIINAQQSEIPSICMIDVFGLEWGFLSDPAYADLMFVLSPSVRDDFIRRGRSPENIVVTGNPAFDQLADPRFAQGARLWRISQGLANQHVVLWADTAAVYMTRAHRQLVLMHLAQLARSNPQLHVIYRPHPSMGRDIPQVPTPVRLGDTAIDLATQVHAAQVVMVTVSTCGIEAALLGKPVLKLKFTDPAYEIYDSSYEKSDRLAPYESMGIALPVRRLDELGPLINACLADSSEAAAMRAAREALPAVGSAATSAVDAIEQLILQSRAKDCTGFARRVA